MPSAAPVSSAASPAAAAAVTMAAAAAATAPATAAAEVAAPREVALFYQYVRVPDPAAVAAQQTALCQRLGLTGRVRLADEGINGLLSGPPAALQAYQAAMAADGLFGQRTIQYKLSRADGGRCPFDGELFVRVASEITATGRAMQKAVPTALGGSGGTHLSAREFHAAVLRCQRSAAATAAGASFAANNSCSASGTHGSGTAPTTGAASAADATAGAPGSDDDGNASGPGAARRQILIDTRNHFETAVGSFRGAVDPKIRCFAQLPVWFEANKEQLRGADVYMFCTGGIRCEKASGYLKSLGVANSVSQLAGGIHSYLAEYSDEARRAGLRTVGVAPGLPAAAPPSTAAAAAAVADAAAGTTGLAVGAAAPAAQPLDGSGADEQRCMWEGVNYTFDKRFASPAAGANGRVGRCCYCGDAWHDLDEMVVCALCADQILVCPECRDRCRQARTAAAAEEEEDGVAGKRPRKANGDAGVGAPAAVAAGPDHVSGRRAPKGGVNFQTRLRAEDSSPFLCTEHQLLADDWRKYLDSAAAFYASKHAPRAHAGEGNAPAEDDTLAQDAASAAATGSVAGPFPDRFRNSLFSMLGQLRRQLQVAGRRGRAARSGRARRHRMQLQMDRIAEWLGVSAPSTATDVGGAAGGSGIGGGGTGGSNGGAAVAGAPPAAAAAAPAAAAPGEFSAFFPVLSLWDGCFGPARQ